MLHRLNSVVLAAVMAVAFWAAIACKASPAPEAGATTVTDAKAASNYTPPKEGTTSLVEKLNARRDATGQVIVEGRLLLPQGTRVWVELYPPNANPAADPIARSELYLSENGTFETNPLNVKGARQVRVQITSHFSRSWQPPEVLTLIGLNGAKLPKSALVPNNPGAPQSGGHLDYAQSVSVQAP